MRPLRSSPRSGVILLVSHSDWHDPALGSDRAPPVLGRRRRGDGNSEILLDSPDCVEIRLQGVS